MAQNKGLWILAKKRMLEDRGCLPRKDGDVLREKKHSLQLDAGGCGRKRRRKGEREQGSQRRGKKKGKGKVEGERERVETKRICFDLVSSKVFEVLCPDSEVESVGNSWVLRCVYVLVVTALFSDVNVDVVCEASVHL